MKFKRSVFFNKTKKEFAFKILYLYNNSFLYRSFRKVEDVTGIAKPRSRGTKSKSDLRLGQQLVGPVEYRGYGNVLWSLVWSIDWLALKGEKFQLKNHHVHLPSIPTKYTENGRYLT